MRYLTYAASRRPAWRFRRCAAAAAAAALAALIPASPAAAIGVGGSEGFGLTPVPDGHGHVPSYFAMTIPAGQSATGTVIVSDTGKVSEQLKISPTIGVTAGNGGATYAAPPQHCSGPGCWVTGLPGAVTLAAGASERLPFTVRVPQGTASGQYLGGIEAEPAAESRPVMAGSRKKAKAHAVIVDVVAVGVAVTVGKLSRLTTRFVIPGVSGEAIGSTARLNIRLDNTGQTFAGATGKASCTVAGKVHAFTAGADTILPHEAAEIAVNAPGLPEGTTEPCQVRLRYGRGLTVSWAGPVALPAPPRARIVHTGPGAYSVVPTPGIPPWAIALIIIGALTLAALAVLLLRAGRSRSRSAG